MTNTALIVHSAGWLEGGVSFGCEKSINGIKTLQTLAEVCEKPIGNDFEIG